MNKLLATLLLTWCTCTMSADILVWKEESDLIVMDKYYLQKVFTKKIVRWPDGQPIQVFIKPMHSVEHKDFVLNTLGLTPFYYQQTLDTQIYSGKASAVVEIPNDNVMILKIEQTPGAIGYINYEIYVGNKKVIVIDNSSIK